MKRLLGFFVGIWVVLAISGCNLSVTAGSYYSSSSSSSSTGSLGTMIISNQTVGNAVTEVQTVASGTTNTYTTNISANAVLTLNQLAYNSYDVRLTVQNTSKGFAVYVNYTNITVGEGQAGNITLEGATLTVNNASQNILNSVFVINDTVIDLLAGTNLSMGESLASPVELVAAPYNFIAVSEDTKFTNTQNISLSAGSGNTLTVSSLGTYVPPVGSLRITNATLQTMVWEVYIYTNESSIGSNLIDTYGYYFLNPGDSGTFTNYNADTYTVKMRLTNNAYYEVETKTSSTNTNALVYLDNTNQTISGGLITELKLESAYLIINNASTNDLYYFYLNDTNGFDLLNIVETNFSTGDWVASGGSFTNGFELVAGNYQVVLIGGTGFTNSLTNTTNLTLLPNTTNTFGVAW